MEDLLRLSRPAAPRDELSHSLPHRPVSPFDRAIDTHVSQIRHKMSDCRDLILSVWGASYQLRYRPEREKRARRPRFMFS
jgi:DNA-binding response OmpR family regulator